jgi:hypothetical protein
MRCLALFQGMLHREQALTKCYGSRLQEGSVDVLNHLDLKPERKRQEEGLDEKDQPQSKGSGSWGAGISSFQILIPNYCPLYI